MRRSFLQTYRATSPPRARCLSGRICASAWTPAADLSPTDTSWTPQVPDSSTSAVPAVSPEPSRLSSTDGHSRPSDRCVDFLSDSFLSLSLSAVVCTECMENSSSYSKDPDYLKHGFGPAGGMEYQQHSAPPPYSHYHSGEQHGTGPHSASLCYGTPNGVRKDLKEFSTNHSLLQQNQHETKGESGVCFK